MSTASSVRGLVGRIAKVRLSGFAIQARGYIVGLMIPLMAIPCGAALAQTVGRPSVVPDAMSVNAPTTITVTAAISGNVIPQSVEVQRLDLLGNPIAIVGKPADNGVSPDLVAGDGVYTGTVSISSSSVGKVALRVSAGFAGSLRRTVSAPVSIDVVPTGFPTTYVPNPNAPTAIDPKTGATIVANEVLACFAPGTSVGTIIATATLINGRVSGRIYGGLPTGDSCYQISLPVSSATVVNNAIQSLKAQPNVTVAEADMIGELQGSACVPLPTCNTTSYNNVQLDAAQKISTGQGVKVAVLDTGVDIYNSNLSPHIAKVIDGADDNGHGTNVGGIVAAVAPQAAIVSIKVCDPACQVGDVWNGLNLAIAENVGVINLSLGFTFPVPDIVKLINDAISKKIVVVAAAGNYSSTTFFYPAAGDPNIPTNILSVGAVNDTDTRWVDSAHCPPICGSNHGGWVKMSAPGVKIVSTGCFHFTGESCGLNPNHELHTTTSTFSGTSQATPFVAGTAALVKAAHPTWDATQVQAQILAGVMPIVDAQSNNEDMGAGRLDALAALGAIRLTHIGNTQVVDFTASTTISFSSFTLGNQHNYCEVQTLLPCAADFPAASFKNGDVSLTLHDTDALDDIGLQLLITTSGLSFTRVISGNGSASGKQGSTFLIGNGINGTLSFVDFAMKQVSP